MNEQPEPPKPELTAEMIAKAWGITVAAANELILIARAHESNRNRANERRQRRKLAK